MILRGPIVSCSPNRLATGAVVFALHAAFAAGAAGPSWLKLIVAASAITFWPGAMALRFFLVDREIEWPGRVAYSFVLGLALTCLVAWAAHLLRFDYGVGLWVLPLLGFGFACVAPATPVFKPEQRGLLPWILLALWVIV